jgi:hypothetical protein
MNEIPEADVTLLARLARLADEIDPVPTLAYELGRAAYELRHVDAALAELVADSAVDPQPLAGVRGELAVRLLSFEAAELDVDLQVVADAGRRSLLGQIMGVVGDVRVETAEGITPAEVDPQGRFQVVDLPAGRMRLQVDCAGATCVTSWVTI